LSSHRHYGICLVHRYSKGLRSLLLFINRLFDLKHLPHPLAFNSPTRAHNMAPNNTPKPIAKGNSTKANPDILSFLDLPAEIRNQIYGILFTKGAVDTRVHQLHNCNLGPWYWPSTSSTSIRLWKMGDDHISFLKDGCNIEGIQSTRAQFL